MQQPWGLFLTWRGLRLLQGSGSPCCGALQAALPPMSGERVTLPCEPASEPVQVKAAKSWGLETAGPEGCLGSHQVLTRTHEGNVSTPISTAAQRSHAVHMQAMRSAVHIAVAAPQVEHDFAALPLCVARVQLRLHNCAQHAVTGTLTAVPQHSSAPGDSQGSC